jgi:GT2 family glycosyltransferase
VSNQRKLKRRRSRPAIGKAVDPPVLIVRPYKQDGRTCHPTDTFCLYAVGKGIADVYEEPSTSAHLVRNKGINAFLNDPSHSKKTHIFFLDDDSTPRDNNTIEYMLSYSNNRKKAVVAGVTPIVRMKESVNLRDLQSLSQSGPMNERNIMDLHWSAFKETSDGGMEHLGPTDLPTSPFIAKRAGGTCLLVRRDALQKIRTPYQKWTYDERQEKATLSEDVYFSDKLKQAGFDIWVLPEVRCSHYHNFDLLDLFQIVIDLAEKE